MKRRDFGMLIIGLVVGLLAGLIALSSNDLREGLFGTAGLSAAVQPAYYLVETGETRNWIASTYPTEADSLSTAFNNVAPLITTSNFAETFRAVQEDINLIVDRSYTALTGQTPDSSTVPAPDPLPDPLLNSLADGDVSACLGLDENPYNVDGYALYLYLEIPSSQAELMPDTWQRLSEPKEDDLFWQRLACQSLGQAQRSQRR
jgi:hypothetical protein